MENTEKKLTYVAKLSLSSEHLPTPSINKPTIVESPPALQFTIILQLAFRLKTKIEYNTFTIAYSLIELEDRSGTGQSYIL